MHFIPPLTRVILSENLRAPYHTEYGPTRLFVHNLVMSAYFDLAIAAVIIVNVVTMAIEHHDMSVVSTSLYVLFSYCPLLFFISAIIGFKGSQVMVRGRGYSFVSNKLRDGDVF